MKSIAIIGLLIVVLFAAGGTSLEAKSKNRLDEIIEALQTPYGPFIESYKIDNRFSYLSLNSSAWDMLTKDQQLRFCNLLAKTDFLARMHLVNAWLLLDGTTIGIIAPRITGGWEFEPEDKYWKYR